MSSALVKHKRSLQNKQITAYNTRELWKQYLVDFISGGDGTEHEPLSKGEQSQEDEVVRSLSTDTVAAGQCDQGHHHDHQGQDPQPRVRS